VRRIELIERQLREADGVAGVLAASWESFELIGVVAAAMIDRRVSDPVILLRATAIDN